MVYPHHHWTVEDFYNAISAGVFKEPKRIEVIHGGLIEKERIQPCHAFITAHIARIFRQRFEPEFWVREEKPIRIAFDCEPIPDINVIAGQRQDYWDAHPTPKEVTLLVEVADSTETYDTEDKALLYAEAGIADYWVSLVRRRELWVFRNPTPDGYADPIRLHEGDMISPRFAPDVVLAVSDLIYWPPASTPGNSNAQ